MLNIQEVYEKYFTVVYRYLLSLSHNTHIAEELTQETFFKALKKVDDFRKRIKNTCRKRRMSCQKMYFLLILFRILRTKKRHFVSTKFCINFRNRTKKSFPSGYLENCHLVIYQICLAKVKAGRELLITVLAKKSGRN